MKKFRSVIAAAMAAAMVLTMTACDEEVTSNNGGNGGNGGVPSTGGTPGQASGESSSTIVVPKEEIVDSGVVEAIKQITDQLEEPDMKVEKRIKWLAWYPLEEAVPAGELFKEVYGLPEGGDDPSAAGHIFEWENVAYADRYTKLATNIQADMSPDLFPFEGTDFPYGIIMNRYQPVDDILDLSSEKWANAKDLMEQFKVGDKYYCAFWEITIGSLMWYKKSAIAEIGAEDPQELFKQGKWDWDAFLDIGRKWQQSGEDKYLYDGWGAEDNFILSSGVPMVSIENGKLKNNLHSQEVERSIGLINTLQSENLLYPRHEVNSYNINPRAWCNNLNLFFCTGVWGYGGTGWNGKTEKQPDNYSSLSQEEKLNYDNKQPRDGLKDYRILYKWPEDEIKVVPFPKDPSADKYYVQMKQDSLMWVKGSTNRNGVKAWIDCCATAALDPQTTEAAKQQNINDPTKQWTAELLDFLYPLYKLDGSSPVHVVAEFKTGLGPSVYDSQDGGSAVASLTSFPYLSGSDTFVTLRDQHEPAINAAIEDLNNRLA